MCARLVSLCACHDISYAERPTGKCMHVSHRRVRAAQVCVFVCVWVVFGMALYVCIPLRSHLGVCVCACVCEATTSSDRHCIGNIISSSFSYSFAIHTVIHTKQSKQLSTTLFFKTESQKPASSVSQNTKGKKKSLEIFLQISPRIKRKRARASERKKS